MQSSLPPLLAGVWFVWRLQPCGQKKAAVDDTRFLYDPYVTAAGALFPCVMFQIDKYAAHHVYSRPLARTLQKRVPIWAVVQQQSRHRSEDLQTCRACPDRSHCRGGCMGRAYMDHGSLMTAEDRCNLRRVVYNWTGCGKSMPKSEA